MGYDGKSIKYTVKPTLGITPRNNPKIRYTLDFDVIPHLLRHTYITNLLYAGVDPKPVQYLAGHEAADSWRWDGTDRHDSGAAAFWTFWLNYGILKLKGNKIRHNPKNQ